MSFASALYRALEGKHEPSPLVREMSRRRGADEPRFRPIADLLREIVEDKTQPDEIHVEAARLLRGFERGKEPANE
jgi:hypothetical protein